MSGVIVERRDHVLITGGRWLLARTFSTAFTMPLSINGPFLTERAIFLHCRLPIADCQSKDAEGLKSAIGNRQSTITWFSDPSGSSSAFACYCASYTRASAAPTASPDFVRLKSCLRRLRAGGPPDSSPRRERAAAVPSSAIFPLCPAKHFRVRGCRPAPPSPCRPAARVALHPTACATVHTRLPSNLRA